MTSRHLLYLENDHLQAFLWKGAQLKEEGDFAADPEGLHEFAAYLTQRPKAGFYLLANLADEGYVMENIPRLWGGDRQALIARKASQHFPPPALTCTQSLGRENSRRKNESLLICGLAASESIQPWLRAIDSAEAALAGIYSPAQLNGRLLEKLGLAPPHCLLLTLFENSLRESYLRRGHTVFSRLIPLPDAETRAIADCLESETGKLRQYLIGQRRIGRDDILPVFVLAPPELLADNVPPGRTMPNPALTLLDTRDSARRLKLKTPLSGNSSLPLFLHLLADAVPRQQFAPPALRRAFRLAQARRLIWAASLGLLFAAGLNGWRDFRQASLLDEESRQLLAHTHMLEDRRQNILATFPRLEISHESLRQLAERHQQLTQQQDRMLPMLRLLAQAMDKESSIALEHIEWQSATQGDTERLSVQGRSGNEAALERLVDFLRQTAEYRVELFRPLQPQAVIPAFGEDDRPETDSPFSLRLSLLK